MIELRDVAKSFGATRALGGVSLELRGGEVHGLAGVNGAGKSTLIRILAGAITSFEGELRVDGQAVRFSGPKDARHAGIAVIHQELSLVGSLTLEDALLLGLDAGSLFGLIDRRARRERAKAMLAAVDLDAALDAPVETMPLAARQLAQLGRALAEQPRVLVMDEPTSALGERDSNALLDRVRTLRTRGVAVLFCTHRTAELYAIADRVTVLRDGACVASGTCAEIDREALVAHMLGESEKQWSHREDDVTAGGDVNGGVKERERTFSARGLTAIQSGASRAELSDVSFDVGRGEVVGLAAMRGGGAERVLEAVCGLSRTGGVMTLDGVRYTPWSPSDAAHRGVVMLAADRAASVLGSMSIEHNATLSSLDRYCRATLIDRARDRAAAHEAIRRAVVKTRSPKPDWTQAAASLSGGNQQKLALSRCLLAAPRLLLLHEPTRGVDVGAQRDLHGLIRDAVRTGMAVIVASSDLDELALVSDRIVALASGRVAGTFGPRPFDRAAITRAMTHTGHEREASP